jgi:tetratricopeptide (TPR) repeat protein
LRARLATGPRLALAGLCLLAAADALRLAAADRASRDGAFDLALALDPRSPSILERRTRALLREGRLDGALVLLDRAVEAAPDRAELHRLRAQALAALGREPEADRAAEQAFALDPLRAAVARTAGERALRTSPPAAAERFRIANLAEPSRTGETVLLLFVSGASPLDLRACVPDHPDARVSAGQAFLDLGMPGAACESLAVALGTGRPEKRLRLLGRARLLLGDREGACESFRAAVEWGGPAEIGAVVEAAREARDLEAGAQILEEIATVLHRPEAAGAAARLRAEASRTSVVEGRAP